MLYAHILFVSFYVVLHQSADFKYVSAQLAQEANLKVGQEKDMCCHLWSSRETTYKHLKQLEIMLEDLNLRDNDVTEGLKVVLC